MEKKFEINLVSNRQLVLNYSWYEMPIVGDKISIDETKIFIVKERMLPITDSNRIVLFGDIV